MTVPQHADDLLDVFLKTLCWRANANRRSDQASLTGNLATVGGGARSAAEYTHSLCAHAVFRLPSQMCSVV